MATATIQQVSTEDIKEAILLLIKENNAEFQQLLNNLTSKKKRSAKTKPKEETPITVVKKERVPYYEMPFWKANPHLKPHVVEKGSGITIETIRELQALFQEPDCPPIEWWLNELD